MNATIEWVAELVFWLSACLVCYAYAGYPVIVWALSRVFGRAAVAPPSAAHLPSISLLIAAHNEEDVIGARIDNALALDYPPDRLEIVVASDGSSDCTTDVVQEYLGRGVKLLAYPENRGKASVLNDSIPLLRGDLVLLSDANTLTDRSAARRLVRWFQRPEVGAVCGKLVLTDPATGRNVDSVYWRYETFLKRCEGRLGALLGANGAIYAIRRSLFHYLPGDTIVDDFVIPLQAKLESGCEIVYDAEAVAFEETAPDMRVEFRRRARIGAGGFQAISRLGRLLLPRYGWTSLAFLSHKVLRWLCPFFLACGLAANLLLVRSPFYAFLLAVQGLLLAAAALGRVVPGSGLLSRVLRLPALFTSMNVALAVGFWRWLSGRQGGAWERTSR